MVDFEKERDLRMWIMEHTGGPAAGGLTVRDVFACTAMGALIEKYRKDFESDIYSHISKTAYEVADEMLAARIKLPPKPEVSVEEAFGFTKPGSITEIKP